MTSLRARATAHLARAYDAPTVLQRPMSCDFSTVVFDLLSLFWVQDTIEGRIFTLNMPESKFL